VAGQQQAKETQPSGGQLLQLLTSSPKAAGRKSSSSTPVCWLRSFSIHYSQLSCLYTNNQQQQVKTLDQQPRFWVKARYKPSTQPLAALEEPNVTKTLKTRQMGRRTGLMSNSTKEQCCSRGATSKKGPLRR